jgi:hypothetical protein
MRPACQQGLLLQEIVHELATIAFPYSEFKLLFASWGSFVLHEVVLARFSDLHDASQIATSVAVIWRAEYSQDRL